MDWSLDIRTLYFIGALTSVLSAGTLLVMRRLHAESTAALTWGALGLVLAGLAMAFVALRGFIPDFVSRVGANTFGPSSLVVLYEAVRRLCHTTPRPRLTAIACLLIFALQARTGLSPDPLEAHLLATSLIEMLVAVLILRPLAGRIGKDPGGPVMATIALAAVFATAHGARGVSIIFNGIDANSAGIATGGLESAVVALFVLSPMIEALILLSWINARTTAELRALAGTDELTGLPTRRSFFNRADRAITAGAPRGRVIALLMIDLDDFKSINDRFGHAAGDQALKQFAETVEHCLRPGDLAGRYGGEEFCVLLLRGNKASVTETAETIRSAVRATRFQFQGTPIDLSVSIGVALAADGQTFQELLSIADRRVYAAKALGRDRVVVNDTAASERRRGGDRRDVAARASEPMSKEEAA